MAHIQVRTWFSRAEIALLENLLNEHLLTPISHDKAKLAQGLLTKFRENRDLSGMVANLAPPLPSNTTDAHS